MLKYIFFIIIYLIFVSCGTNDSQIKPLIVSKELQVKDSVTIPDACFVESFIQDSLLVLVSLCDSNNFQIYNKNSLKLIRKFGRKGKAPYEFHTPLPYKTNTVIKSNGSGMKFYDVNLVRDQKIDLNKISSGYNESEAITSKSLDKKLSFSNDLCLLEGERIAARGVSESDGLFYVFDPSVKTKNWINYMPHLEMNKQYRLLAYYGYLCSDSRTIVYAARYFDEILFFNSNGKLTNEFYFSKLKSPILSSKYAGVSNESMLYFMKIYGTSDYCYILRLGRSGVDIQKDNHVPSQILVFDWTGTLIDVYQLDIFPSCFCVDEVAKMMYCIAKSGNKENVQIKRIQL